MLVPSPIERTREGDYLLRLSDAERELLRSLPLELLRLLAEDPGDPTLRRLRQSAYEDDEEADGETASRERLTAEELDAWLRALTDLRLALGTRLEVTEDTYDRDIDPRDPAAYELSVFAYLSWLQEQAVEAALG